MFTYNCCRLVLTDINQNKFFVYIITVMTRPWQIEMDLFEPSFPRSLSSHALFSRYLNLPLSKQFINFMIYKFCDICDETTYRILTINCRIKLCLIVPASFNGMKMVEILITVMSHVVLGHREKGVTEVVCGSIFPMHWLFFCGLCSWRSENCTSQPDIIHFLLEVCLY